MIRSNRETIGTEAFLITYPETVDSIKGQTIAIKNHSEADSVYLGGPDLTSDNGFKLGPGAAMSVELVVTQDLYVVSTGTVEVSFLYIDVK